MIDVEGLSEVVLNVRDMPRALAFYQGLLGLERMSPVGTPGPVFLRAGRATERLPAMVVLAPLPAEADPFVPPRALHHLALAVSDASFAAARQRLEAAGLEVRDGTHPILDAKTVYVFDPDGNEVELMTPN